MQAGVQLGLAVLVVAFSASGAQAGQTVSPATMDTVGTKSSSHRHSVAPDVSKVPSPPAPSVPIPYPNMGSEPSADEPKVKIDGAPVLKNQSTFKNSSGDEAGTMEGVISNKVKGKTEVILPSPDVKVGGKPVERTGELTNHNKKPIEIAKPDVPKPDLPTPPLRPVEAPQPVKLPQPVHRPIGLPQPVLRPVELPAKPLLPVKAPTPIGPVPLPTPVKVEQPVKAQPVLLQQPRVQVPVRR